ncbi:hypothetical protein PI95_021820 [Hassallia byssoidea VB512170]|uniref:Uncharacterized protein n=1 Tax=Hassallia byssoidea VB512170 TaxID=1304833 RepID=A0A846HCJ2_9CYAN|nr:hypothetical protein [Hassalia byssoidea]NEU75122.1 hypothetical protein [Hassalia byssoidea VB512170]
MIENRSGGVGDKGTRGQGEIYGSIPPSPPLPISPFPPPHSPFPFKGCTIEK